MYRTLSVGIICRYYL